MRGGSSRSTSTASRTGLWATPSKVTFFAAYAIAEWVVRQPLEIYTKGAYSLEPDLYVERRAAVTTLAPLARTAAASTARTAATPLARQPPPHL